MASTLMMLPPPVRDTIPAPAPEGCEQQELFLPVPECPPTLDALPEGPENDQPAQEDCPYCEGSGVGACLVPPSWEFPGEFADCVSCGGKGVR